MAAKVPIRAVFDGSTATGLAEFQSAEFIALAYGGLGASLSIGSAGQVLKVNSGASALEFGGVEAVINIDGMIFEVAMENWAYLKCLEKMIKQRWIRIIAMLTLRLIQTMK